MEYKNGYILLEQKEVDFLSFMLFNDKIDARYEAQEYIGALMESQALFQAEKERYTSMNDRGAREAVIVELIDVTIASCDHFMEMGRRAAREAGTSIEFH